VIDRSVDVCIIGAGPHGLAVSTHLVTARPALRDRLVVIDPAGTWLTTWRDQFARLGIDVLRSAMVHHPGVDPGGLGAYTQRRAEPTSGLPYGIPLAAVFEGYCNHLIGCHGLAGSVLAARALQVGAGDEPHVVTTGGIIRAQRVIVAANPCRPCIPAVFGDALRTSDRIKHSSRLDLRTLRSLTGERVIVIGGGLTAAHLVCGAIERGADVTQIVRRPVVVRDFDVEPAWLGPRELNRFGVERDPARRVALVRGARGGGSVPPWMDELLAAHCEQGRLQRIVRDLTDARVVAEPDGVRIDLAGTVVDAQQCWLATGTTPALDADPALAELDVESVDGYPVLDPDLCLRGTRVHVVGRLAAPTIGPAAGNLWGARVAARRISRAVTGIDLDADAVARIPAPIG
jgi:cation diffusion facilitator CzcD-associated flavoprotein CzcO